MKIYIFLITLISAPSLCSAAGSDNSYDGSGRRPTIPSSQSAFRLPSSQTAEAAAKMLAAARASASSSSSSASTAASSSGAGAGALHFQRPTIQSSKSAFRTVEASSSSSSASTAASGSGAGAGAGAMSRAMEDATSSSSSSGAVAGAPMSQSLSPQPPAAPSSSSSSDEAQAIKTRAAKAVALAIEAASKAEAAAKPKKKMTRMTQKDIQTVWKLYYHKGCSEKIIANVFERDLRTIKKNIAKHHQSLTPEQRKEAEDTRTKAITNTNDKAARAEAKAAKGQASLSSSSSSSSSSSGAGAGALGTSIPPQKALATESPISFASPSAAPSKTDGCEDPSQILKDVMELLGMSPSSPRPGGEHKRKATDPTPQSAPGSNSGSDEQGPSKRQRTSQK